MRLGPIVGGWVGDFPSPENVSRSFPLAEFALARIFAEPLSQTEEEDFFVSHRDAEGQ